MNAYNFGVKSWLDEILKFDVTLNWGVKASTIFGGTAPLKFGRAKNVHNLIRFTKTFKFDRIYF